MPICLCSAGDSHLRPLPTLYRFSRTTVWITGSPLPDRRFSLFPCPASSAGGTLHEVPKDPVTSGNAEAGVFVYVQPYAALSGPGTGLWTVSSGSG
ncbi:hypothetical protein GCM10010121_069400 [Streptomyces brasiliensis]|uniref:Uncharacterized protein n=1 Tax=Streptomyces brasiliensis TaxID=1954 RepID=A0A917L6U0_9ACTN|nr:hypothetical protein GCM10010121_069400 [Streptomyces brasiliensis]